MTISNTQTANLVAANLIQQWNNLAKQTQQLLSEGRPLQGQFAAFSASDLTSALGSTTVATLQQASNLINPPSE